MPVNPDTVVGGIAAELADFTKLVRTLSTEDLARPTRCAGWTIADVAGHVIGTVVDLTEGRLEGQGTPQVTQRQADERAGRDATQLADELSAAIPVLTQLLTSFPAEMWDGPSLADPQYTLGFSIEAIWYDAYLHADDIRCALGAPPERGPGLGVAIPHVTGYLEHKRLGLSLRLDGLAPVDLHGGGAVVTGDPYPFLLVATGRADPASLGLPRTIDVYGDFTAQT